ncbi:MAG: hypothetical protein SPL08_04055 [Pseudomonadota bacterium]|nr:hypothetical protein [Pseudomonadota bacterium]
MKLYCNKAVILKNEAHHKNKMVGLAVALGMAKALKNRCYILKIPPTSEKFCIGK